MIRIHFLVEGQTEETFVNKILTPYFSTKEIYIDVRLVGNSRYGGKIQRGGITSYQKAKNDIQRWLTEDQSAYLTTMFDFYYLPKNFPGRVEAEERADPYNKVAYLETEMKKDINSQRFIPYIQLHEFEALLFTRPDKIDECMALNNQSGSVHKLEAILKSFKTPEHIDQETPPSKRLKHIYPTYRKVLFGPLIAEEIGIPEVKTKCKHFSQWLEQIEKIKKQSQKLAF